MNKDMAEKLKRLLLTVSRGLFISIAFVVVACGSSQTQSSTPTPASVPAGTLLYTYPGHTGTVYSVAWSPDGREIASGSGDNTVQVWEAMTGKRLLTHTGTDSVNSVAWSPDGRDIASGSADHTVQVWKAP